MAVSWQGRIIDAPLEAVRRTMSYLSLFADTSFIMFPAHQHNTLEMVKGALDDIRHRSVLLGWIRPASVNTAKGKGNHVHGRTQVVHLVHGRALVVHPDNAQRPRGS